MGQALSSERITEMCRLFSLYTLQSRALPHVTDGLKSAARRVLWCAKDGKKYKTASLAGGTLHLHPHAPPESAINTMAAYWSNNIPLLSGTGAFGTLISPGDYGAGRYTYVQTSKFTNDVIFRDIEIVPMMENYDSTEMEPIHFLPLVPTVLLNPQQGVATGFSTNILPRALIDILIAQINHLNGENIKESLPNFTTTNNKCIKTETDSKGQLRYIFRGEYKKTSATTVKIINLPYGITHAKFMNKLDKLEDNSDKIVNIIDNSKDIFNIDIQFKRGFLSNSTEEEIYKFLELETKCTENLNVIDFNSESIHNTNYKELIQDFSDWRLSWYSTRYKRLKKLLELDIQKYRDIITAIDNDVGGLAKEIPSRNDLKHELKSFNIVNVDYIADLPVYRFTVDEKKKIKNKLSDALKQLKDYNDILRSEDRRRDIYVSELQEILVNAKKGKYKTIM